MIEVDVVKIDVTDNKCVGIKRMTIDDWKSFKKQHGFIYFAFQLGFHSFKVEK